MNALFLAALLLVTAPAQPAPDYPSADSPAWPEVHGPFSWADRIMNSGRLARSGGIYKLRQETLRLFTPTADIEAFAVPDIQRFSVSEKLDFFSYALGSELYRDAAALLYADGLFEQSDTLQYLRGVVAYDVRDFSLAAAQFAAVPESSSYSVQAKSFLDVWNSTPEVPGYKARSPFLAAAMSAVIPGSGKIYAGDLRSGISTFLVVGALGGMAAESWIKLGGRDWRTIALSSVFGLFYIGNIYGSAVSVSVITNTYQDAQKATLLFDLRIPLHQF